MLNMGELSYGYVKSIALWSLVVRSAFFVARPITQRAFDSTSGAGAKNDKSSCKLQQGSVSKRFVAGS